MVYLKEEDRMNDEDRTKTALWKYGLIAPAVNGTHNFSSDRAYFRHLAEKEHIHPVTGEKRRYCIGTFEVWANTYRRLGYEGLVCDPARTEAYPDASAARHSRKSLICVNGFPRL